MADVGNWAAASFPGCVQRIKNKEPGYKANWSSTSGLEGVPEIEICCWGREFHNL